MLIKPIVIKASITLLTEGAAKLTALFHSVATQPQQTL